MGSWFSIVKAGALVCLPLFPLTSCSRKADLPVYGKVPPFTLTSQDGKTFSSRQLEGAVWVADFMFTTCTGPCPRMSSEMHHVQEQTGTLNDVKLVSFTVDPQHDTPPVLAAYAKLFLAQQGRWFFLTGPAPALNHLDRDVFMLGNVDGSKQHSTRFILVDRKAQIRGYYLTSEPDAIPRLLADVKTLSGERS